MNSNIKPFLKWAGGKSQLLGEIIQELPADVKKLRKYVEPFIGAGAVFICFLENDYFEEYIINDINSKLINLYTVIRDKPEDLISEIQELKTKYLNLESEEREKLFYEIRANFNNSDCNSINLASYFIFLNKTCFNGLYRENSKGNFNVPFGKYSNPSFFDEEQLMEISRLLNLRNENGEFKVKILNKSFNELEEYIDADTFVYCDPPYRPVTVGGFTSYNKSNFNDEAQTLLRNFYKVIDAKGAKIMLSNSDPKNLDEKDSFFDDLYADFIIKRVYAKRNINSVGSGRGKITELLITNYKDERGMEAAITEVNTESKSYLETESSDLVKIFTKSLLETNRGFNFYVNWQRPATIVSQYNIELNTLNALVKNKNYDDDFKKIVKRFPTVINVLPALFALSKDERENLRKGKDVLKVVNIDALEEDLLEYRFNIGEEENLTEEEIEKYLDFTKKIGLKYLFTDLLEKHLIDYLIGCEVGLDSNGRKNRGGLAFELALEPIIYNIAKKYNIEMLTQKQFKVLRKKGFEISEDIANRKADFILIKDNKIMNIEANFYGGSGSKPEEIIDSYINRQEDLRNNNIEFALITDGKKCWGNDHKPQLLKGFRHLNHMLNFNMSKNGMLEEIINNIF
ncbi:DpnII family type II restriction endonuclease [Clostridium botulinum]|uniref:DpnII family type II restriction endonuclease n=1 Tax=Clostridium botulinum TaxID=1491 RepID=UPI0009B3DC4A|nr:DpnII family type II restriction endonuclease [Clostridium botulinum]NFE94329.1 Dam family site-specific DNA-(adenine-N6)-methyltransferase [Clostridium botulinum]NFL37857.1 Dam family site-specific DNA-(adenine-N6)-methyltransferase [Clostridium botulinum]NFL64147.1 Dam family site-specific DNA-(adenine-N6)-methyltransferase [Clostridium botulinum]NFN07721.1 Dam family site-specific DNA-(adenine-N6)-methyltransferase [Clostridium botulinum]NFN23956.1 Dam family site-specific DNA-(adenine-N